MKYIKKTKFNTGGQIGSTLGATATSFIPGVGPLLAPIGGMVGGAIGSIFNKKPEVTYKTVGGSQMKNGGKIKPIGKGAKKYLGPKHENGGILIDEQGNPTNTNEGIAEVEGGETEQGGYIFSDTLIVPDTDMTFADAHEMLITEGAPQEEIEQLAMIQEQMNGGSSSSDMMMQDGGKLKDIESKYFIAKKNHKEARKAIGTNDKKTLNNLGFERPYNNNDLARDYNQLSTLRNQLNLKWYEKLIEEGSTLFPHVGQQVRGTLNKWADTNFKNGGNLPKYQDGGDPTTRLKLLEDALNKRTIRDDMPLMTRTSPTSLPEIEVTADRVDSPIQSKRFYELGKGTANNETNRPFYELGRGKGSIGSQIVSKYIPTPQRDSTTNVEQPVTQAPTTTPTLTNEEQTVVTSNTRPSNTPQNTNFANRLLQNLMMNKMRLDVERIKTKNPQFRKTKSTTDKPTQDRTLIEGGLETMQEDGRRKRSVVQNRKGGFIKKFVNGGFPELGKGIITPEYNLEIPKLQYSPSIKNTMYSTASRVDANKPLVDTQLSSTPELQFGSNTGDAGLNWRNIGTGIQAATRLGAALFTPKPKALPRASYIPLSTTSPVFNNARRQAGAGFVGASKANPNMAYAQYLDATSNIAGQEADYRSQREALNEQMRQGTEKTNIELTARNQEARDADMAARMGLVAQAIDIPVTTMARDEAMKKQLLTDLTISADRISDPVERQRLLTERMRLLGFKNGGRYISKLRKKKTKG